MSVRWRRSTPCAGTRAGSGTMRSVYAGVRWRWSSLALQVCNKTYIFQCEKILIPISGFTFDLSTCSCIPKEENDIANLVTDERVERSDTFAGEDDKHAEMIIIAALAGIATVFFIIIISLLNSIKTLRSTIRSIKTHTVDQDSEDHSRNQSLLTRQKL